MVVLSYLWSRKHYPIPYKTVRILAYLALALLIYFLNELFLQHIGKFRDLTGLLLLAMFVVVVWLKERHTLKKYKYEP
jgi:peptidoglycan/LPS O-acetylase OafA/YrhL